MNDGEVLLKMTQVAIMCTKILKYWDVKVFISLYAFRGLFMIMDFFSDQVQPDLPTGNIITKVIT